jgi:hypothetical protein
LGNSEQAAYREQKLEGKTTFLNALPKAKLIAEIAF